MIDKYLTSIFRRLNSYLKTTKTLEKAATPQMWEDFRRHGLVWKKGTPKSYWWCCDQYGYPILGKAASKLTARRVNIDCFLRFSETSSESEDLKKYYEVLRECKFSNHCCSVLKKEPSEKLQAELDVDVIFKGLMAAESHTRTLNFATRGYLFAGKRKHIKDGAFYHCSPMAIWTDNDVWEYIRRYNVSYCELYDIEYENAKGETRKIKRNGCYGCCTDIEYADNHMSVLRKTHNNLWNAVMRFGMADELINLASKRNKSKLSFLAGENAEWAIENRPCAFDTI